MIMENSKENESQFCVIKNEEKPNLKGDYRNLVILFLLYVLQGDENTWTKFEEVFLID